MKKRKQPEENGYSLVRLNSRITRFDGNDGGSDGADGGFGSEAASPSPVGDPGDIGSSVASGMAWGSDSDSSPSFGDVFGGGGEYYDYSGGSAAPQYSLNNYIPQNMERQFYQPIYRPQYTDYRGGISGLLQQPQTFQFDPQLYQPNYGISSLPQSYSSTMPFRGQQFASYGLPFSGYNWPTYSNGGGISSLVR